MIPFELNGKAGVVIIGVDYFDFTYECQFRGKSMEEMTFSREEFKVRTA